MAYVFYVTIKGSKQGAFKGESIRKPHKDKIEGISFEYEVVSPRDVATGQASGKRQHKPVKFTKEWGAASPLLFTSCVTNEVLDEVLFEFYHTTDQGVEEVHHKIKLTKATVASVKQFINPAKHAERVDIHELEEIALTFQKIEIDNVIGKTAASDDWIE